MHPKAEQQTTPKLITPLSLPSHPDQLGLLFARKRTHPTTPSPVCCPCVEGKSPRRWSTSAKRTPRDKRSSSSTSSTSSPSRNPPCTLRTVQTASGTASRECRGPTYLGDCIRLVVPRQRLPIAHKHCAQQRISSTLPPRTRATHQPNQRPCPPLRHYSTPRHASPPPPSPSPQAKRRKSDKHSCTLLHYRGIAGDGLQR